MPNESRAIFLQNEVLFSCDVGDLSRVELHFEGANVSARIEMDCREWSQAIFGQQGGKVRRVEVSAGGLNLFRRCCEKTTFLHIQRSREGIVSFSVSSLLNSYLGFSIDETALLQVLAKNLARVNLAYRNFPQDDLLEIAGHA